MTRSLNHLAQDALRRNVAQMEVHANIEGYCQQIVGGTKFEVFHPIGPVSLRQRTFKVDGIVYDRQIFARILHQAHADDKLKQREQVEQDQPTNKTFVIDSLSDIAAIPADVRVRLLRDLPELLDAIGALVQSGKKVRWVTWTDDAGPMRVNHDGQPVS